MTIQRKSLLERFENLYIPEPNSGCWLWLGATNVGYGIIHSGLRPGHACSAHRFSYRYYKGPIPRGFVVDHQCNNPSCVNPDHLKAMTQFENVHRHWDRVKTCKRGHPFDEANTYWRKTDIPRRYCRACGALHARMRYAKKRHIDAGQEAP